MSTDIMPKLNSKVFNRPSGFRRDFCYCEGTDVALRRHEPSLRAIFSGLAASHEKAGAESKLISLDEWRDFLRGLTLIGTDLTERDATLCFSWSRMCVIDDRTERGAVRDINLPFEGFLVRAL